MTTATVTELPATPAGLLAFARSRREAADRMEADLLQAAVDWALLHPARGTGDMAGFTLPGSEHVEPIAGQGCPAVSEFCIAEFGAVVGLSTVSAKHYLGQALELAHRLPRLWRRVQSGSCPAWKARRIAETTIHAELAPEAAVYVDRQAAPFAHRMGNAAVGRLVDEAIARFHPDRAESAARDAQDARHVTVEDDQVSFHGTMRIEAELDLADALDFRDAVVRGAKAREQLGWEESVDVRRAKAVGDMARRQLALDLVPDEDIGHAGRGGQTPTSHSVLPAAREIVLYVHLADAALHAAGLAPGALDRIAKIENGHHLALVDQIRAWCADSHTRVTVKPIIDLHERIWVPGYDVPHRLREQVVLRDKTCVFPRCTRSARRCDIDHVIPYHPADPAAGGQTASENLAPLCRRHHRLKTHGRWRYRMTSLGVFEWTSPHGHRFRRDHTGTSPISDPDPPDE
jgi:hypothetical protein